MTDKIDGRKNNGGARPGSGPKPKDPEEKKITLTVYVKKRHVDQVKNYVKSLK